MAPPRKFNRIVYFEDHAEICMPQGALAFVSLSDVGRLKGYTWGARLWRRRPGHSAYATTSIAGKTIKMAHLIMGKPGHGFQVDHINGDKLDNRRENLRIVTAQENAWNRRSRLGGVRYRKCKISNPWEARITVDGKLINFGQFASREEALAVRRKAEIDYFGEFAPRR